MKFQKFLESKQLNIPDPTDLGLEIFAQINIVPGPDGTGAYAGQLHINTPDKVGGLSTFTDFYHSEEAAQTALRELLQKPLTVYVTKRLLNSKKTGKINPQDEPTLVPVQISGLRSTGTHSLTPQIKYGGSWDQNALQNIKGYDKDQHEKHTGFLKKLKNVTSDFQKQYEPPKKFGDGPPTSGQFISKKDVELFPDMIETFGSFKVVLKWSLRPRQIINAIDLYKHYDTITKDAEVKTGDYIREAWIL
jgi:hypothetical protein